MLRFRVHQLHVPSLGRHLLPLPKLGNPQLRSLSSNLEARGFSVRPGRAPGRIVAVKGSQRISIDGPLGLASSASDMLDALAPAVPGLLASPSAPTGALRLDVGPLYFSLKRSGSSTKLHVFPRMESLRTWTCLRRDGLCGLTPDEAAVLGQALAGAPAESSVGCLTSRPRNDSTTIRVGRNLFFGSEVRVGEFLSTLRTIESRGEGFASYLPRNSTLVVPHLRGTGRVAPEDLGEWSRLS